MTQDDAPGGAEGIVLAFVALFLLALLLPSLLLSCWQHENKKHDAERSPLSSLLQKSRWFLHNKNLTGPIGMKSTEWRKTSQGLVAFYGVIYGRCGRNIMKKGVRLEHNVPFYN